MKYFLALILTGLIITVAFSGTADTTWLDFNPADNTIGDDVAQFNWHNYYSDNIFYRYTLLALEKSDDTLYAAEEEWYGEKSEAYEIDFPLGRINIKEYAGAFLGITLNGDEKVTVLWKKERDIEMMPDGKLSFFDSSNTRRKVYTFTVRGDKVRFIDDDQVYLTVVLFMDQEVPFYGIYNSKFFPMIKQNGSLIRTSTRHFIQMKAFAYSSGDIAEDRGFRSRFLINSQQLLKRRAWTTLAEFILQKDNSDAFSNSSLTREDIYKGMFVLAQYDDQWWYPAMVTLVENDGVLINFADADKNDLYNMDTNRYTPSRLKPFFWSEGTVIYVKEYYSDSWSKGSIRSIDLEDEMVYFFYDGGDLSVRISLANCRCE